MANFGLGQIGNDSPRWAKWFFRIYFFTSKAFIGWGAATDVIPKPMMNNITLLITLLIDPVLFGLSKMFGITPEEAQIEDQQNTTDAANKA